MDINFKSVTVKDIVKIGTALNNPYRLKILNYCENESHTITEIQKKIDLTYANVYKHVKILNDAGLIETKADKDKRGKIVLVKSLYKITKNEILKKVYT